jgi:hypothetical protein
LACLFDGVFVAQFLPWTVETAGDVASPLSFQESTGRIEIVNVSYDLFGNGSFFGDCVDFAVFVVGPGGDEGAESFVAGMGGDVYAATAEDVVVGGDYGLGGTVVCVEAVAHCCGGLFADYCSCDFVEMRLSEPRGEIDDA